MLDRLAGNSQLKQTLQAALQGGRLSHSVLLCGEKGAGAGFAARCLAADYLYPQGGPGADQVMAGESPECIQVRGEGVSGNIPVARIREVRRAVFDTALSANGRVVILYDTQNLNGSSGNALLKVLEEPPEGVLFILTASSQAAVMPTIRSRCGAYAVGPVPKDECVAWLNKYHPGCKPAPADLALLYDGHIGLCRDVVTDPARAKLLETARTLAEMIAKRDEYGILCTLTAFEKDKPGVQTVLRDLCCLSAATLHRPGFTPLTAHKAGHVILRADEAAAALAANGNPKLVLTNLGIRLAKA